MTYLFKCSLHNISHPWFVHSFLLLLVLSFSIIVLIIPNQSERRQHTIVKAQDRAGRLSISVVDSTGKMRIRDVTTNGIVKVNSLCNLEALVNFVQNILSFTGYLSGVILIGHAIFFPTADFVIPILNRRLGIGSRFFIGFALLVLAFFISLIPNFIFAMIDAGRFE